MHKSEFVVSSKRELNVNSLNSLSTYRQLHLVEPVMHSNLILTKAGPSQTARWRSPNPDCRIMPLVSRQNARLTTRTSARAQFLGSGSRSSRLVAMGCADENTARLDSTATLAQALRIRGLAAPRQLVPKV